MSETPAGQTLNGPLVQSLRIVFRVIYGAVILLAVGWLGAGIQRVPADSSAVVLRFGRIVRVQGAGLLIAWPRPIEQVVLLPGPDRPLTLTITGVPRAAGLDAAQRLVMPMATTGQAGSFLTGDGGVALLDAALVYRITDPAAYHLALDHVAPALRRAFAASAVAVVAAHDLDDVLVARPGRLPEGAQDALRQEVRDDLLRRMNRRLGGLDLGVAVTRIDVTASLPQTAKLAFDGVLTAAQLAEQGIATARTEAARTQQQADRDRDRILAEAHAAAAERISDARAKETAVVALEAQETPATRATLMDRAFRDQAAAVLAKAGRVTTVDPRGGRVILPGSAP